MDYLLVKKPKIRPTFSENTLVILKKRYVELECSKYNPCNMFLEKGRSFRVISCGFSPLYHEIFDLMLLLIVSMLLSMKTKRIQNGV